MLARFIVAVIEKKYYIVGQTVALGTFNAFVQKMITCFLDICSESNSFIKYISYMLRKLCEKKYFHHLFRKVDALNVVFDILFEKSEKSEFTVIDLIDEKKDNELPARIVAKINVLSTSMAKINQN